MAASGKAVQSRRPNRLAMVCHRTGSTNRDIPFMLLLLWGNIVGIPPLGTAYHAIRHITDPSLLTLECTISMGMRFPPFVFLHNRADPRLFGNNRADGKLAPSAPPLFLFDLAFPFILFSYHRFMCLHKKAGKQVPRRWNILSMRRLMRSSNEGRKELSINRTTLSVLQSSAQREQIVTSSLMIHRTQSVKNLDRGVKNLDTYQTEIKSYMSIIQLHTNLARYLDEVKHKTINVR